MAAVREGVVTAHDNSSSLEKDVVFEKSFSLGGTLPPELIT